MSYSDASITSAAHRRSMTDQEEKERRASIKDIMKDPNLTPHERRKSIHFLMDGRRRSSAAWPNGMDMAAAAAMAAAEFDDSSDDEDEIIDEANVGKKIGSPDSKKRKAKKRSSSIVKRGSSRCVANEKPGKRRPSLRDSFTMGFSKMGVKKSPSDNEPSVCLSAVEINALSRKQEKSRPPCGHYERNCSIVSPCCGLAFGCRICHDDAPELPPPFLISGGEPAAASRAAAGTVGASHGGTACAASLPSVAAADAPAKPPAFSHRSSSLPLDFSEDETHHEIDRFLIEEVICRECFTRQSSKTNNCVNCGIQFGTYHCSICNLWMTADEDPYHCIKCGFCRVGGRENFTHCDDCGMCIDALLFEDHNCMSGKYMSNCPVCQEDLFSSRMASHEMPCGHAIHWHCFRELTSHDTRCPVCKKTAEPHDQMEQTWNAMAMGIALQPVPAEMARVVDILCNDCEEKSVNQSWHFLGVQCRRCTSFNITVEKTVLVGQDAADFLGPTSDIAAQAQWASGAADRNVLTALMGGGASGLPTNNAESMDTETMNQSVAADVMGVMDGPHQPFSRLDEDDEMGQS